MPITVISSGPVRMLEPAHIIQVCCLSHLFCDIQLPQSVLEFNRNSWAAPRSPLSPVSAPTPASSASFSTSRCKFQLHKPHPKLKYAAFLSPLPSRPPASNCNWFAGNTSLWWRQLCLAIWLSGSRQAAYPIDWHWPRGSFFFFFLPISQKAFGH